MPPLCTNGGWVARPLPIPMQTLFACHPRVCTAPGSCAPLAHKRGAGGALPSYSHTDPICVSPQHTGQGEGVLPGVCGPGFLCPPCTQMGQVAQPLPIPAQTPF